LVDWRVLGEYRWTITFATRGLYQFKTKVIEMGPMMEVKTIGPDNTLRLTISVR
jgi:hypothetical protein